jgi:hypothetical protein
MELIKVYYNILKSQFNFKIYVKLLIEIISFHGYSFETFQHSVMDMYFYIMKLPAPY